MKTDTTFELVEVMFSVSRLMKGEMEYTNNVAHLSILQLHTLKFIGEHGEVSMSKIAEKFHIEHPSATSLLNKLYDQNFVVRRTDTEDRRLVHVSLTAEGRKLLERAMHDRRKKIEKILSYLSDTEKKNLLSILKTLQIKLQERV